MNVEKIEKKLRIQLRKLSGEDFSSWVRSLNDEEKLVFTRMWNRDSQKRKLKKTYRKIIT